MNSAQPGSIRLFRFAGIQVYLHWSWFLVAVISVSTRANYYSSWWWNVAEYLALFAMVLLHEFGHSLACRQTGGQASEIVLWPLGGIAYVAPPPRAGAMLWSIAAGPLVNVALYPLLAWLMSVGGVRGGGGNPTDLAKFLFMVWWINRGLLIFNLLPIYPLDGGQILRSLLWFPLGRVRSLFVAASIGFVGVAWLAVKAFREESIWTGAIAFYLGQQCLIGFKQAQALTRLARMPRHVGFACPTCREAALSGPIWSCRKCGQRSDVFAMRAVCPQCQTAQAAIPCVFCGGEFPLEKWATTPRRGQSDSPVIDV